MANPDIMQSSQLYSDFMEFLNFSSFKPIKNVDCIELLDLDNQKEDLVF